MYIPSHVYVRLLRAKAFLLINVSFDLSSILEIFCTRTNLAIYLGENFELTHK